MTAMIAFFGRLGTTELIVIALIVLLLFGGRKIPELMRGLGKGVREFKDASSKLKDELKDEESTSGSEEKRDEKRDES